MNLVLSRLRKNIDDTQKNLFAGEWCIYFGDKKYLKSTDYEVHPHRWEDRNLLHTDLVYLEEIYEKYLRILVDKLNSLHGTSHDLRYWRIVIGPWLQDFIELLFNYYSVAKSIDDLGQVTNTKLYDLSWNNMVPQDLTAFQCAYSKPSYIHFLLSQIIVRRTSIPYDFIGNVESLDCDFSSTTGKTSFIAVAKRLIKYTLSFIYSLPLIPAKYKKIAFVASYFNNQDLWYVQKPLGLLPFSYLFDPQPKEKSCNKEMRKQLALKEGDGGFETLLDELIPLQMPIAYMENYSSYVKISKLFFPKEPNIIFTSNSYYFNEAFKIWSASSVENGSKLLISGHGGFGTSKWMQTEKHQILISDRFYTWGWGDGKENLKVMPSTKLNATRGKISYFLEGYILCVLSSDIINHLHTQLPQPLNSEYKEHVANVIGIESLLSADVSKIFKFRLYHTNYNRDTWKLEKEFEEKGLSEKLDEISSFYESASGARLSIITYHPNATSLETLSANHPTLLFFDKKYFELNKDAEYFFSILEDVGVFHQSPETLVAHIEKVYRDIDSWWLSKDVQKARSLFCDRFAYTSDQCIEQWVDEFRSFDDD